MNLLNPVTAVKDTYKYLNDKRIRNLTKTRGKFVKDEFKPGQFVLLNDESQLASECKGKLNIPYQSRLYKVLETHKKGFSAKILDVVSGAQKEVLTSRLRNLTLETLEEFNFSSPTFYRSLQLLTDKFRNKYVPGLRQSTGLKLLHHRPEEEGIHGPGDSINVHRDISLADDPPGLTDHNDPDHFDKVQTGLYGENHTFTDDVHNGINERITNDVHTDGVGDGDDEGAGGVDHGPPDGIEDRDVVQVPDYPPPSEVTEKRKTRYQGSKHVPVFSSHVTSPSSIIKQSSYKMSNNFRVENMKIRNKAQFNSRKIALLNHHDICTDDFCNICNYFQQVKDLKHDSASFARYVSGFEQPITHRTQTSDNIQNNGKKVSFSSDTIFCSSTEFRCLPLDMNFFYKSCFFNTSFAETKLLLN